MAASLLSAKYRKANPEAQVASLARIGRRATAKADWLEWEAPRPPNTVLSESDRAEVARWRERASQAVAELCQIVVDNPQGHWSLPQRRAAAAFQKESAK